MCDLAKALRPASVQKRVAYLPGATEIATFPVADCVGVLTPGKAEFLLGDSLGTGPTDLN